MNNLFLTVEFLIFGIVVKWEGFDCMNM